MNQLQQRLEVGARVILMRPDEAPAGYANGTICESSADGEEYVVELYVSDGVEEVMIEGEIRVVPRSVLTKKRFPKDEMRLLAADSKGVVVYVEKWTKEGKDRARVERVEEKVITWQDFPTPRLFGEAVNVAEKEMTQRPMYQGRYGEGRQWYSFGISLLEK